MKIRELIYLLVLSLLFGLLGPMWAKNNTTHLPTCDLKSHLVDNFCIVEDGVFYRSKQLSAKKLAAYIKKYKIKTVVNLRGKQPKADWWQEEADVTRRNKVCFVNIDMTASKLTSKKNIRAILNIFDKAPRPILVHCQGGADRTGEVSALWVLDQQHKSNSIALQQLTIWNRHNRLGHPEKAFLIKIWKGRKWFDQEYDPTDFPEFEVQED